MNLEETKQQLGLTDDFRVFPQDRYANYLKGAVLRKTAHEKVTLLTQDRPEKGE